MKSSSFIWVKRESCYNETSPGIGKEICIWFWAPELTVCVTRVSCLTSLFFRSLLWNMWVMVITIKPLVIGVQIIFTKHSAQYKMQQGHSVSIRHYYYYPLNSHHRSASDSAGRLFVWCTVQNGLLRMAEISLPGLPGWEKALFKFASVPLHPSTPRTSPNLSTFWLNEALQENLGILPQDPHVPQAGSSWDKAHRFQHCLPATTLLNREPSQGKVRATKNR